jgi:hypothetical protein
MRQYASQSGYTLAQVSDAWDAAWAHCKEVHNPETDEWGNRMKAKSPGKQEFLNSLKTPEIK